MEEKELLEDQMESKEWEIKLCKKNIVSTEEEVRQYEKKLEKGEASRFELSMWYGQGDGVYTRSGLGGQKTIYCISIN